MSYGETSKEIRDVLIKQNTGKKRNKGVETGAWKSTILNSEDVAGLTGRSLSTIRRWASSGEGPIQPLPRTTRSGWIYWRLGDVVSHLIAAEVRVLVPRGVRCVVSSLPEETPK